MNNFQIGQEVKSVSDTWYDNGKLMIDKSTFPNEGKVYKVKNIYGDYISLEGFPLGRDEKENTWDVDCFEAVNVKVVTP